MWAIDAEVGGAMGLEHAIEMNVLVRIEDVGATFRGRRFRMTGYWLFRVGNSQISGPLVVIILQLGD